MKKGEKYQLGGLLLLLALILAYGLDLAYLYWFNRSLKVVVAQKLDGNTCELLIPVTYSPLPHKKLLRAAIYARNNQTFTLLYQDSPEEMYLNTTRWGRTGFEVMNFSYRVTDPGIRLKLHKILQARATTEH